MTGSFAWLTPPAPAALALLRLRDAPAALFDRAIPPRGRARFLRLLDPSGATVDEAVVWNLDDTIELSVHGGAGVRAAVEASLRAHGMGEESEKPEARSQEPGASSHDAWLSLSRASSPAAVAWLLRHGPSAVPPFRRDFLARAPIVLITGPANAGKSTLLNAWCGRERALVSAIAGTTRDLVVAETMVAGWRLRLMDSAGLRDAADEIERAGQELVALARKMADVVIYLRPPGDESPAAEGDVDVLGKADLRGEVPADALAWSSVGSEAAERLRVLGERVIGRLGLAI